MDVTAAALLVSALLGAGGLAALFQAHAVNRRTDAQAHRYDADAEVTLGAGWQKLVGEQRLELNELRERLAVVESREEECRRRLAELEDPPSGSKIEAKVAELVERAISSREVTT